jgi:hypothetical protein
MLADSRKNQSKVEVSQTQQPKTAPACSWQRQRDHTKATMVRPEIRKTGLWISRPNGPICV